MLQKLMIWLQLLLTLIALQHVQGTLLRCGEDIVVKRGAKKTLRFWRSDKEELMKVEVIPQRNDPSGILSFFKTTADVNNPKSSETNHEITNIQDQSLRHIQEIQEGQKQIVIPPKENLALQPEYRIDDSVLNEPSEPHKLKLEESTIEKDDTEQEYAEDSHTYHAESLMTQNGDDLFNSDDGIIAAIKNQIVHMNEPNPTISEFVTKIEEPIENGSNAKLKTSIETIAKNDESLSINKNSQAHKEIEKELSIPQLVLQKIKQSTNEGDIKNFEKDHNNDLNINNHIISQVFPTKDSPQVKAITATNVKEFVTDTDQSQLSLIKKEKTPIAPSTAASKIQDDNSNNTININNQVEEIELRPMEIDELFSDESLTTTDQHVIDVSPDITTVNNENDSNFFIDTTTEEFVSMKKSDDEINKITTQNLEMITTEESLEPTTMNPLPETTAIEIKDLKLVPLNESIEQKYNINPMNSEHLTPDQHMIISTTISNKINSNSFSKTTTTTKIKKIINEDSYTTISSQHDQEDTTETIAKIITMLTTDQSHKPITMHAKITTSKSVEDINEKPESSSTQDQHKNIISITNTIVKLIEESLDKRENLNNDQVAAMKTPKIEDIISKKELEKKITQASLADYSDVQETLKELLTTMSSLAEESTIVPEITTHSKLALKKKVEDKQAITKSRVSESAMRQKISDILSKLNAQKNSGNYDDTSAPLEIYPEDIGFSDDESVNSNRDKLHTKSNVEKSKINPLANENDIINVNEESSHRGISTSLNLTTVIPITDMPIINLTTDSEEQTTVLYQAMNTEAQVPVTESTDMNTSVMTTILPVVENLRNENAYASIDVSQFIDDEVYDSSESINMELNPNMEKSNKNKEEIVLPSVKMQNHDQFQFIAATDDIEDKKVLFEAEKIKLQSAITNPESNVISELGEATTMSTENDNASFIKENLEQITSTNEDNIDDDSTYNYPKDAVTTYQIIDETINNEVTTVTNNNWEGNLFDKSRPNIDIKKVQPNNEILIMDNTVSTIMPTEPELIPNSEIITEILGPKVIFDTDIKDSSDNEEILIPLNLLNQNNKNKISPESTTIIAEYDIEEIATTVAAYKEQSRHKATTTSSDTITTYDPDSTTVMNVIKQDSIFGKETGSDNVLSLIRNAIKNKIQNNKNFITIPFGLPVVQPNSYANRVVVKEHQSKVVIITSNSNSAHDKVSQTVAPLPNGTETASTDSSKLDPLPIQIKSGVNKESNEPTKVKHNMLAIEKIQMLTSDLTEIPEVTTQASEEVTKLYNVDLSSFTQSGSSTSNNTESSTLLTVTYTQLPEESSSDLSSSTSASISDHNNDNSHGKLTLEGKRDNNFLNLLEKYIIDDSPSDSYVPEEILSTHIKPDDHVNNPVNEYFFNKNHNYGNINRKISLTDIDIPQNKGYYEGADLFHRKQDNSPPLDLYEGGIGPGPSLSSLLQTINDFAGLREPSRNPESSLRRDDSQYPYGGDLPFFIKLPGTPNAVPVFLQYEPVKIRYVKPDEMTYEKEGNTEINTPSLRNEVITDEFQSSLKHKDGENLYNKGPDPFFLMDPPNLGNDDKIITDSHVITNSPTDKESLKIDLKSQLNFNRKTNKIPSTISGSKTVYPGEYFFKNPDNSYSSSDTETLSNPVFNLGSRFTQTYIDNENPQYTPFPLTTNPPRINFTYSSSVSEEFTSTAVPLTIPTQMHSIPTTKIHTAAGQTSAITTNSSTNEPPSIIYSPAPSIDYNNTFDAVAYPDLPIEERTIEDFPDIYENDHYNEDDNAVMKPHAEKIYTNDIFGSSSDMDLTKDEEFDIVALANFLHQNQKIWSSSNASPLPHSGAWRGPSWNTVKYAQADPKNKAPLGDSPWLETERTLPHSRKQYAAFYSPEDIPGLDPLYFSYRQMPRDSYRVPKNLKDQVIGLKSYIETLPLPMKHAILGETKPVRLKKRSLPIGEKIYCEWNFKTDPGLYLLVTFHNLSAPFTIDCFGAYIEVERESNGYGARWCGNRASLTSSRQHVIFAKQEVRISIYDDGEVRKKNPTGFEAEIEAIDLFDSEDYNKFIEMKANPRIRRLMQG